jgi:hypothetical protein
MKRPILQVVDYEGRGKQLARGKDSQTFRVYRVEQVNGPWLWLVAEGSGVKGWARAAYVIPFDQAVDYITNQIRANLGVAAVSPSRGALNGVRRRGHNRGTNPNWNFLGPPP